MTAFTPDPANIDAAVRPADTLPGANSTCTPRVFRSGEKIDFFPRGREKIHGDAAFADLLRKRVALCTG
jgi:hypothetical protein